MPEVVARSNEAELKFWRQTLAMEEEPVNDGNNVEQEVHVEPQDDRPQLLELREPPEESCPLYVCIEDCGPPPGKVLQEGHEHLLKLRKGDVVRVVSRIEPQQSLEMRGEEISGKWLQGYVDSTEQNKPRGWFPRERVESLQKDVTGASLSKLLAGGLVLDEASISQLKPKLPPHLRSMGLEVWTSLEGFWNQQKRPPLATYVASAVPTSTEVGRRVSDPRRAPQLRWRVQVHLWLRWPRRVVQRHVRGEASHTGCRVKRRRAAEQLAALEAELEALEDEMEEERLRQADLDEAQTMDKIQQRFKDAAPGLDSEVVPGRGSAAVGVAASVCVCGAAGEDTVAQRVLRRLEEEAVETPVFLAFDESPPDRKMQKAHLNCGGDLFGLVADGKRLRVAKHESDRLSL
eukprot:s2302_g7.t1